MKHMNSELGRKEAQSDLMYREHILEHYKHPLNQGRVENPTMVYTENNPLCGDEIEVSVCINNGVVNDIKFQGHGCAISQAAASIMTEELKGKKLNEVLSFSREDMLRLLGIELSAMRLKCALLARHVLHKGLVIQRGNHE